MAELLSIDQVRAETDKRLAALFANYEPVAAQIDPVYKKLLSRMQEFIRRPGGKRLRPYLMYLSYIGSGGTDAATALDVAVSLELYHNLFLIHDDIIDRDLVRYNGPNIAGAYLADFTSRLSSPTEARHLADSMALLAGDATFGLALSTVIESNFSSDIKVAAVRRINRMIIEEAGGELLDVMIPVLNEVDRSKERLLQVCRYKTASYSFSAPLQLGAICAGQNSQAIPVWDDYAIPLGIAYQLADDILGMFGDEKILGKPGISDLREGKQTIMIDYFLAQASEAQKATLMQYFGNPNVTLAQLKQVRQLLEVSGARKATVLLARSYAGAAKASLDKLDILPSVRQELVIMADLAVERQK